MANHLTMECKAVCLMLVLIPSGNSFFLTAYCERSNISCASLI